MLGVLTRVTMEFFWGEAAWGLTLGLRRLRLLRLGIILLALLEIVLICWATVQQYTANDSYSYYEGKVLEEKVTQAQKKVDAHDADMKRLMELVVRMQAQLDSQQNTIEAGIKILIAGILTPVLAFLWSIFKSGLRRERMNLPGFRQESEGRRGTNGMD